MVLIRSLVLSYSAVCFMARLQTLKQQFPSADGRLSLSAIISFPLFSFKVIGKL